MFCVFCWICFQKSGKCNRSKHFAMSCCKSKSLWALHPLKAFKVQKTKDLMWVLNLALCHPMFQSALTGWVVCWAELGCHQAPRDSNVFIKSIFLFIPLCKYGSHFRALWLSKDINFYKSVNTLNTVQLFPKKIPKLWFSSILENVLYIACMWHIVTPKVKTVCERPKVRNSL